jgi:uncharacterized protein (TIGR03663 family)
MKVPPWAVALFLFALALGLRLPRLDLRLFHADEAVHAEKFRQLWETGRYRYDPSEFHGPTIYYAALPVVALSGHKTFGELTESDLRRAIALLGAALVPFLLLLRPRFSTSTLLWAGLFCAISPALVFYSRYFIQEIFLIVFTLGFLIFASRKQPILAGIFAGLMVATKETAILTFFAAFVAYLIARRGGVSKLPWKSFALGAGVALTVAYLTLSGFLREPTAPLGYFQTYTPWLRRAGGAELHVHPWSYYYQTYFWQLTPGKPLWTEGLFLILGIIGAILGWKKQEIRFLVIYTILLFGIYSAIPYKTPWCGINFLFPLIVLAGNGADQFINSSRKLRMKISMIVGILLGSCHLLYLAYQTNFVYFTDLKNPYVYSPTLPDARKLAARLERITQAHPDGLKATVQVISRDGYYWPLPWELRRFKNVGYWSGALPENVSGPLVLASPKFEAALETRLPDHKLRGMHALRMGVFYDLFVEKSLWDAYQKTPAARLDDDEE